MQAARRRGGRSGRRLLLLGVTPHVGWHRRRHRLLPRLTVAMHGGGRRVGEPCAGGAKPNATPHSADWVPPAIEKWTHYNAGWSRAINLTLTQPRTPTTMPTKLTTTLRRDKHGQHTVTRPAGARRQAVRGGILAATVPADRHDPSTAAAPAVLHHDPVRA